MVSKSTGVVSDVVSASGTKLSANWWLLVGSTASSLSSCCSSVVCSVCCWSKRLETGAAKLSAIVGSSAWDKLSNNPKLSLSTVSVCNFVGWSVVCSWVSWSVNSFTGLEGISNTRSSASSKSRSVFVSVSRLILLDSSSNINCSKFKSISSSVSSARLAAAAVSLATAAPSVVIAAPSSLDVVLIALAATLSRSLAIFEPSEDELSVLGLNSKFVSPWGALGLEILLTAGSRSLFCPRPNKYKAKAPNGNNSSSSHLHFPLLAVAATSWLPASLLLEMELASLLDIVSAWTTLSTAKLFLELSSPLSFTSGLSSPLSFTSGLSSPLPSTSGLSSPLPSTSGLSSPLPSTSELGSPLPSVSASAIAASSSPSKSLSAWGLGATSEVSPVNLLSRLELAIAAAAVVEREPTRLAIICCPPSVVAKPKNAWAASVGVSWYTKLKGWEKGYLGSSGWVWCMVTILTSSLLITSFATA